MAIYTYEATDPGTSAKRGAGAVADAVRGTISADSPRQARDTLRSRGLRVRDLSEVRTAGAGSVLSGMMRGRHRHEAKAVAFYRELATLLSAGITLVQGIEAIARQHRGLFHDELMLLRDRITAGAALGTAMRRQPRLFDAFAVSMVEVGERTGSLEQVLDQLAAFKQRSHQMKNQIGTALIYPAIVTVAGVGVTIFLMTFVVPRLLETLTENGRSLPLATRLVKGVSDALLHYGWLMALFAAALAFAGAAAMRSPGVRRRWHAVLLGLPLIGTMIRKQTIVRLAVTLAVLSRSGVAFVQALRIAREAMPNLVFRDALSRCERAVGAGRGLAPALESAGVFPAVVVQIVDVGQASGQLDRMLERLAADYDAQVQTAAQRLVAVLEPMLILLLAGFIGLIVMAVILPYMQASQVL